MVRVMVIPGVWEEAKECEECQGEGRAVYEVAVPDYMRGGDITEKEIACQACNGDGFVRVDYA
tara:strand:+ start:729 stop:917 length:189 start_codon:yes stop_codon:yes gene_type:complete